MVPPTFQQKVTPVNTADDLPVETARSQQQFSRMKLNCIDRSSMLVQGADEFTCLQRPQLHVETTGNTHYTL